MAYVKTIWENLPSESTPINASNLNKMENGIYDNSVNIDNINDELDTTTTYSTDEQVIGTWIDGKPIYRKVVLITTASIDITAWTNLFSIPNIDNLIECYGYLISSNVRTPIPRYESENYSINFLVQNEYLKYRCSGFHSYSGYLIIEYTKTTD